MAGLFKKALSLLGLGGTDAEDAAVTQPTEPEAPPPVVLTVLVACGSDLDGGNAWVETVAAELDAGVKALGLSEHIDIRPAAEPIWDIDATADPNDLNAMVAGVGQAMSEMNGHFAVMVGSNPFEDQLDIDFISGQFRFDFATLALAGRYLVRVPMEAEDRAAFVGLMLGSALPILDAFHDLALEVLPAAVTVLDGAIERDSALFELTDKRNFDWMRANVLGHLGALKGDAQVLEQSRSALKALFDDGYEGVNEDAIRLRLGMDLVTTQANLAAAQRDNDGYKSALSVMEDAVQLISEHTMPDDHARAQALHFRMLLAVGRLFHDAERLSEAVRVGRELTESTDREVEPLQWVSRGLDRVDAQLALSGERPSKSGLDDAVTLLTEALQVEALETAPQLKFETLDMLARTHFQRGTLDPVVDHVTAEIAVLEQMIELLDKDDAPDLWARIQNSLGDAWLAHHRFDRDLESLDKGIAALQRSSTRLAKDPNPVAWANMHLQLGSALKVRGDIKSQTSDLRAGVRSIDDALRVFKAEEHPEEWANCQQYLGQTLYLIAAILYNPSTLNAANTAFEKAKTIFTRETGPRRWAEVMDGHGRSLILQGELLGQLMILQTGLKIMDEALMVRTPERDFHGWVYSYKQRCTGMFVQAVTTNMPEHFQAAISTMVSLADHESELITDGERGPVWHDLGSLRFAMFERRIDQDGYDHAKEAWAKARACYERAGMVMALEKLSEQEAEVEERAKSIRY